MLIIIQIHIQLVDVNNYSCDSILISGRV